MDLTVLSEFDSTGHYIANPNHSDLRKVFKKFLDVNGLTVTPDFCDALLKGKNFYTLDSSNPRQILEFALYRGWIYAGYNEEGNICLVADCDIPNLRTLFDSINGLKHKNYMKASTLVDPADDRTWFKLVKKPINKYDFALPTKSIKVLETPKPGFIRTDFFIKNQDVVWCSLRY